MYVIVFLLIAPIPPPPLRPSPASLLSLVFFQITSRALAVESRMWSLKDLRRGARWGRAITWASRSPIPAKDFSAALAPRPFCSAPVTDVLPRLPAAALPGGGAACTPCPGTWTGTRTGSGRAASEPCAFRSPALRLALRPGVRRLQAASWTAAKRKLVRLPHLERLTNEPTTHSLPSWLSR